LYDYFNRSKVFVHTAIYESYGIVIGEAFRFNNYIVSTDIGCAKELIAEGMGELVEYDANDLSRSLQRIIDGKIDINAIYRQKRIDNRSISWENEVRKLGSFEN
jgi:glycosyltransferase involved in cell wall biosynthesis